MLACKSWYRPQLFRKYLSLGRFIRHAQSVDGTEVTGIEKLSNNDFSALSKKASQNGCKQSLLLLSQQSTSNKEDFHRHNVLIVDDNDDNLLYAQYAVESLGYQAITTLSGHDAVAAALACSPDIILLDIWLGDISGVDVFYQIRQHEKLAQVPIIAVTALAQPVEKKKIMAVGFSGYLIKPYMVDELHTAICAHLSNCKEESF